MELLDPAVRYELFEKNGRIFTKVKDEPPAKYNDEAVVKNSIVADGCIIEGHAENSILFRGVKVKRGAVIKNSIIMQDSVVCENTFLDNCILDKCYNNSRQTAERGQELAPYSGQGRGGIRYDLYFYGALL